VDTKDGKGTRRRRKRREFTEEFKAGAVRLVLVEGRSVTQVAQDLDLTRSALDTWVSHARAEAGRICLTYPSTRAGWPVISRR